jgi:hypothetical protein
MNTKLRCLAGTSNKTVIPPVRYVQVGNACLDHISYIIYGVLLHDILCVTGFVTVSNGCISYLITLADALIANLVVTSESCSPICEDLTAQWKKLL